LIHYILNVNVSHFKADTVQLIHYLLNVYVSHFKADNI
jgi:hypothetical protein